MINVDFDIEDVCVVLSEINDDIFAESLASLNDSESYYVKSIQNLKRQREVAVTLFIFKQLFGSDTILEHNENGKPFLKYSPTHISISHSGNFICIAYSDTCEVGVDIQFWNNALYRTVDKYLSTNEQKLLDINNKTVLLKSWTAKEATYKIFNIKNLSLKDIDTLNDDYVVASLSKSTAIKLSSKTIFFDNYAITLVAKH
ncbi:MAG: 4'-phosphopantetheinyl transferase family protein [Muribaculaceae bacterium]